MMDVPLQVDRNKIVVPFLAILTLIAVGFVLRVAQSVVLPLFIAWLLSYILGPAINFMTDRKVPTPLATALVLTILLWLCYMAGTFFIGRVQSILSEADKYQNTMGIMIDDLVERWPYANPFADIDWYRNIRGYLGKVAGSLLSFLSNLILVVIYLIFLLLGKPFFKYKLRKALPVQQAGRVEHIFNAIATQIGQYLSVQFLISFATGLLVWLALHIIGVDFAVTWGALAFVLNFIPTIGSIVASIPPVLLALVQYYPSPWYGIAAAIALLTIQMVVGNGISPKIMGDKLNLSPVVVLLSLIFWGWLWGVTGALLSTPIAAAIKIVCENIEPLRPISIMMGSGKTYRAQFVSDNNPAPA